jgi:MYXO-CTERM domain-containing protein
VRRPLRGIGLASLALFVWGGSASADPEIASRLRPVADLAAVLAQAGKRPPSSRAGKVPVTFVLDGTEPPELGLREIAPGIGVRWVEPRDLGDFVDASRAHRPWVTPPLKLLLDSSGVWTRAQQAHELGATGKGVIVGVVDTGLDLTHPDFRDESGHTRVAWMLDLGASPAGLHPELEDQFGCTDAAGVPCAVFARADLDAMIVAGKGADRDVVGHGSHVASISAGNGGKGPGIKPTKYVGMAPEATLVVARVTGDVNAGAITDADILSAVSFVFDRAKALKMPAAVNVSLGGDYGPHDGTSPLEVGLSRLVGATQPGRAIVLAAGNSAGIFVDEKKREFGVHTEVRVTRSSQARAILSSPLAGATIEGSAYVWIHAQAGDELRIGVEIDGDEIIPVLGPGEQGAVAASAGRHPYIAVINGVLGENSPLNPGSTGAVLAFDGTWAASTEFAITIEGHATAQLWVQGTGDADAAKGGALFLRPIKQGTINVPASHPDLLAVGCSVNRLVWVDDQSMEITVQKLGSLVDPPGDTACYFSAAGPNALGAPKPEITAPGAFVAAAMALAANPKKNPSSMFAAPEERCPQGDDCYVVDSHHAISSGTSMSAPHVTGAVALLLERDPTLTQPEITTLLQGGSRRLEGIVPLEEQVGPGGLDILGSFAALDYRKGTRDAAEPAPGASWVSLSSEFARPDGSWPVTGNVTVRAADGSPADGFDESALTLELEGGVLTKPLARVGPGLYRFVFAGARGGGGGSVHLAVRYAGALIEERTLPVAPDVWSAREAPQIAGGCAFGGEHDGRTSVPGALGLLGLAVLARRRRVRQSPLTT